MELAFYEATSAFTWVTTRTVAYPAYPGLCRWASENSVSIIPCHPSYMASGFLPWRDFHPQASSTLRWARPKLQDLTPFSSLVGHYYGAKTTLFEGPYGPIIEKTFIVSANPVNKENSLLSLSLQSSTICLSSDSSINTIITNRYCIR